jgi:hypothetical protein
LIRLELSFHDYSPFYHRPQASLSEILPLDRPWLALKDLILSHIFFKIAELEALVEDLSATLTNFDGDSLYLLDGSWIDALDTFRGFHALRQFSLSHPIGMQFGNDWRAFHNTPDKEMEEYVLRRRDRNPLLDYRF